MTMVMVKKGMQVGRNGLLLVLDFRWAMHSSATAKDLFKLRVARDAEDQPHLKAMQCFPTELTIEGTDQCLVLKTKPLRNSTESSEQWCCLYRCGRVCAKVVNEHASLRTTQHAAYERHSRPRTNAIPDHHQYAKYLTNGRTHKEEKRLRAASQVLLQIESNRWNQYRPPPTASWRATLCTSTHALHAPRHTHAGAVRGARGQGCAAHAERNASRCSDQRFYG